jgi:hypothetical protein
MRSTVAKRIRKQVYGAGHHLGPVEYFLGWNGGRVADGQRQRYQRVKQEHRAGTQHQHK